jgi:hypothetical protein
MEQMTTEELFSSLYAQTQQQTEATGMGYEQMKDICLQRLHCTMLKIRKSSPRHSAYIF